MALNHPKQEFLKLPQFSTEKFASGAKAIMTLAGKGIEKSRNFFISVKENFDRLAILHHEKATSALMNIIDANTLNKIEINPKKIGIALGLTAIGGLLFMGILYAKDNLFKDGAYQMCVPEVINPDDQLSYKGNIFKYKSFGGENGNFTIQTGNPVAGKPDIVTVLKPENDEWNPLWSDAMGKRLFSAKYFVSIKTGEKIKLQISASRSLERQRDQWEVKAPGQNCSDDWGFHIRPKINLH